MSGWRNLETVKGTRPAVVSVFALQVWIRKLARMLSSLHLHTRKPLDVCSKQVLRFAKLKRRTLPWSRRGLRSIPIVPLEEVNAFVEQHLLEFVENYHWNYTQVKTPDSASKTREALKLSLSQIHCSSHISLAPVPLKPTSWLSTYVH